MVGYAGSPTRTVYVGVTLTRSKVKVNVTGLLNFRQLAKPCMLAAMTAAPLRGFLVYVSAVIANKPLHTTRYARKLVPWRVIIKQCHDEYTELCWTGTA